MVRDRRKVSIEYLYKLEVAESNYLMSSYQSWTRVGSTHGSIRVGSGPDFCKFRRLRSGQEICIFFTFFANCKMASFFTLHFQ
jgi:hypothetical protein